MSSGVGGQGAGKIRSYRDLEVWKLAMQIAEDIFKLTDSFPPKQNYILVQQMQRAAISLSSNIAEGHSRNTTKDYLRFLNISYGSMSELETQTILSVKLGFANKDNARKIMKDFSLLGKKLNVLCDRLNARSLIPNLQTPTSIKP